MSSRVKYVLDANVFIEAKRRYYAFDVCSGFWESLIWLQSEGRIGSIDRVKNELVRGGDDLTAWITSRMPETGFDSTDHRLIADCFGEMVAWVQSQSQFFPEAKAQFASGTDGWLMAYVKTQGHVLVTHEVLASDAKKKVPMPNVCRAFNIPYMDSFEMLRTLSVCFTWQNPR